MIDSRFPEATDREPGRTAADPSAKDQVMAGAERAARETGEQAKSFVEQQRGSAARQLEKLGDALTSTARALEDEQHPSMASLMSEAATRVEGVAESLRNSDVDTLLRDTQRLARQQPVLFFGGAVTAGFMLTRFLKSSESSGAVSASTSVGSTASSRQGASQPRAATTPAATPSATPPHLPGASIR